MNGPLVGLSTHVPLFSMMALLYLLVRRDSDPGGQKEKN